MKKKKLAPIFCLLGVFGLSGLSYGQALFEYSGKKYARDDLSGKLKNQVYEADLQAYRAKHSIIDQAVIELHIKQLAKAQKKTPEQVEKELFGLKEPTEKELKKFYEENKARIPYPFDKVKADIKRFVQDKAKSEKRHMIVEGLRKKKKFVSLVKEPEAPIVDIDATGFARRGNAKSKVTVVEFADYKCPHCGEAAKSFKSIYKKYDKKVNFVFVDFPLRPGLSEKLAEGAACAGEQNKYWEYHTMAFEQQASTNDASVQGFADKVGLDKGKFKSCLSSGSGMAIVKKGRKLGESIGVTGTPAVYVNGKKVMGYTKDLIEKAIDNGLSGAGRS